MKLIIVTGNKNRKYGELLSALVSPDAEFRGVVETEILSEKEYAERVGSFGGAKIVFIGKNAFSKELISGRKFDNRFSRYGVYFGAEWDQAVICTDLMKLSVSQSKYDRFIDEYNAYLAESGFAEGKDAVNEKSDNPGELIKDEAVSATKKLGSALDKCVRGIGEGIKNAPEIKENIKEDYNNHELLGKASKKTFSAAKGVVKGAAKGAAAIAAGTVDLTKDVIGSGKDIADQQYRCGVTTFYADELKSFLGL